MYPTITDLLKDLFGIPIPLPIQTFGFFMALSFAAAYYFTASELKRKTAQGLLKPISKIVIKNKPVTAQHYITNMLTMGLIGFKLLEMVFDYDALVSNPQAFILSAKGNVIGLLIGAAWGYYNTKKEADAVKGKQPEKINTQIAPADLMWNITAIAGISGIIGAKLFHNLEYIDDLIANPVESLLSFSGLTFYGGLIVATVAVLYYTTKHGIPTLHMIDAAAPALMLAYGIGRIGCQLSGDGDWGIVNTAVKPEILGFLPDWFWSFNYPHNVVGEGIPIAGCEGPHCFVLAQPVYPTPLYEAMMGIALFGLLWGIRKKITIPGVLFCVYMIVNGMERFAIEKIRVNSTYQIFGMHITQAEIISSFMVIAGIIGAIILFQRNQHANKHI